MLRYLLLLTCALVLRGADPRKEMMAADRAFAAETAARGLDGWMSWFADEARLNTHQGILQGKAALRLHYSRMFARKEFTIRWEPTYAEASEDGTMGFTFGSATSSYIDEEGKKVERPGRYVTIWRRQADGKYKAVTDMGN